MQAGSADVRKPAIEKLSVKRMSKFVMSRNRPVRQFFNSRGFNEEAPVGKFFADIFNLIRRKVQRSANRPDGEALSSHAPAFQNSAFGRTQMIDLSFQHVLQCFWDARIYLRQGCR